MSAIKENPPFVGHEDDHPEQQHEHTEALDNMGRPVATEYYTTNYVENEVLSSPWEEQDNDAFLMALRATFDNGSEIGGSPQQAPRSVVRRSIDFSGLKQVPEEGSEDEIESGKQEEVAIQQESFSERENTVDNKNGTDTVTPTLDAVTRSSDNTKNWHDSFDWVNPNAVRFGLRISVVLTASSLFVLAQPPDSQSYPQGVWVYISALMVSWFPNMTAASVVEKTFQRILGTCIGASLGIGVGFLSILFPEFTGQAIFIGFSVAVISFFYSFATVQFTSLIFGKYSYASLLCLLTFGISVLPFYTDDHPKWKKGVFRVINVVVGCTIGGIGSIVLWPKSTKRMLHDKIEKQVKLAGEASRAVLLFAADTQTRGQTFRASLTSAADMSMRRHTKSGYAADDDGGDALNFAAHDKYNQALAEWKGVSGVFPLAKWDPFLRLCGDPQRDAEYREQVALTLARALRIQTTVVILDGLVRNDQSVEFTSRQVETIKSIGQYIKSMLTPPYNAEQTESAAEFLLDRLDDIREFVSNEVLEVSAACNAHRRLFSGSMGKEDYKRRLSDQNDQLPLLIRSHDTLKVLFLQLVEHLVVRSLRLYYIWRQVEE